MKGAAKAQVRRMAVEDIPAALELSTEAGWNQTAEDWQMLTQLAPETCLAIDMDGELASTTTLLCYGSRLAWLGMVLTQEKVSRTRTGAPLTVGNTGVGESNED